jgi:cytochrome oxidase Cu insertion factor (SCO1/SenC/PrrC family)
LRLGGGARPAQALAAWGLVLCLGAPARGGLQEPDAADPHAAHRKELESRPSVTISTAAYEVPDVTLLDESGREVPLRALLKGAEPVALNFIFTTCTTICPVMTATFAQMRRELGADASRIRMVSISVDPEYDRPAVLKRYAEPTAPARAGRLHRDGGTKRVLEAFGAYRLEDESPASPAAPGHETPGSVSIRPRPRPGPRSPRGS